MVVAFLAALDDDAPRLVAQRREQRRQLGVLREARSAAYPDLEVDETTFVTELARRLGPTAAPDQLARLRGDHVHLAIACIATNNVAIRHFETEFLAEVDATASRMRATRDQADDVRSHMRRILFVSEPGRPAALSEYSGRGDLRSYLKVIATRAWAGARSASTATAFSTSCHHSRARRSGSCARAIAPMSMPRSARPTTVGELNTAGDETPIALSGDQCRLYFTSSTNRPRVAAKPPLP